MMNCTILNTIIISGINEINTITGISLNSGTIITQNPHQDSIHELGVKIRLKSLEKWLLESSNAIEK